MYNTHCITLAIITLRIYMLKRDGQQQQVSLSVRTNRLLMRENKQEVRKKVMAIPT